MITTFDDRGIADAFYTVLSTGIVLLAGLVAIVVAWFTRNTLITIVAGMIALLLLQNLL